MHFIIFFNKKNIRYVGYLDVFFYIKNIQIVNWEAHAFI